MKRLCLLFLGSVLICSAQEVRLARPAILKSGRTIVSLKTGTMVELLERDGKTLTVRFNKITGVIPATSLTADTAASDAKPETQSSDVPSNRPGSHYVNSVNKAKANVAKHEQNEAKQVDEVLKN